MVGVSANAMGIEPPTVDPPTVAPTTSPEESEGWRRFRTYWIGHLLSFSGDWFTILALPLVAWELSGSAVYVAVVEFAELAATLVIGLRLGGLADRLDPRRTMIVADALRAGLLAVLGVWVAVGSPPLVVLPLAALVLGSLRDLHDGAENVMVVSVVPPSLLVRANGRFQISDGLGQVVGALLAGVTASLGYGLLFGLDAFSFLVAGAAVVAMGAFPVRRDDTDAPQLAPWHATVRSLRAEDRYWRLVVTMVVANVTTICFMGQFVPFAREELGLAGWQIGLTLSVMGVGSIAAGLALDRVSVLPPRLMVPATAVMSVTTVLTGLARSWPVTLVVFLLNGAVVALGMATVGAMRHGAFPAGLQGRVAMATRLAFSLGVVPGVIVGGLVAERFGSDRMYVVFGAAAGIAVLVGLALGVHRLDGRDPVVGGDGDGDGDGPHPDPAAIDLRDAEVVRLDPWAPRGDAVRGTAPTPRGPGGNDAA